jgi:hypothetical protein
MLANSYHPQMTQWLDRQDTVYTGQGLLAVPGKVPSPIALALLGQFC